MILIADSGSTKTDWALIDSQKLVQRLSSVGLNPDFHSDDSIEEQILTIANQLEGLPTEIHFYGSGASSEARQIPLLRAFEKVLPDSNINVSHDLLGAARASLGDEIGIVGILGTGSNCCAYDGKQITKEYRSGGYILSDEGGGVFMGKLLLKAFIEDELESQIHNAFSNEYNLDVDQILKMIYKEPYPNRFIASFSKFILRHHDHTQMRAIIEANFNAFFEQKVSRFENYTNLPLGFVGSIANHFEIHLKEAAERFNCRISVIEAKPIDALIRYHQAKLG